MSALELRAFLANCNGFGPLFTGYGYTADDYAEPLVREHWVENVRLREVPNHQVVAFRAPATRRRSARSTRMISQERRWSSWR